MTIIALTGTPRQVSNQLSMLVDPLEPFRRPKNGVAFTGQKAGALWDARGQYWQMRDPELVMHTELCVNPLDAPRHLPLDWGLRP